MDTFIIFFTAAVLLLLISAFETFSLFSIKEIIGTFLKNFPRFNKMPAHSQSPVDHFTQHAARLSRPHHAMHFKHDHYHSKHKYLSRATPGRKK